MALVHCYNKGCGQKFDPNNNPDDACLFHPGGPIFHDAMKGWSCCKKRSTDFTEFLNFPGCTKGQHSNMKPVEPEKQTNTDTSIGNEEVIVVQGPKQPPPNYSEERPPADEPMVRLKTTVTSSLKQALEKHMQNLSLQNKPEAEEQNTGDIVVGTSCKNSGCKTTYKGEESNKCKCQYHPGVPIFHEGMKYWSCCQRKTSDFANFLDQEGCEEGNHLWFKQENEDTEKKCRYDWHQTGPMVIISVFSKVTVPEKTWVEVNRVGCNIHIVYEGGKSLFTHSFNLRNVIVPEKSEVKMMGTKVEINLRKQESFSWPSLEVPQTQTKNEDREGGEKDSK